MHLPQNGIPWVLTTTATSPCVPVESGTCKERTRQTSEPFRAASETPLHSGRCPPRSSRERSECSSVARKLNSFRGHMVWVKIKPPGDRWSPTCAKWPKGEEKRKNPVRLLHGGNAVRKLMQCQWHHKPSPPVERKLVFEWQPKVMLHAFGTKSRESEPCSRNRLKCTWSKWPFPEATIAFAMWSSNSRLWL